MSVFKDRGNAAGSGGEDWRVGEAEIGAETGLGTLKEVYQQGSVPLT